MKERTLLFHGSKERLRRSIQKQGGSVLPERRFRLTWRSKYFRRGLSFRIQGSYERREDGILLTYRFAPTAVTLLWVGVPVLILLSFALWECGNGNNDSAAAVALFSILYPAVALWQAHSCHQEFCRYFEVVTK